jgi:hypothetical protein
MFSMCKKIVLMPVLVGFSFVCPGYGMQNAAKVAESLVGPAKNALKNLAKLVQKPAYTYAFEQGAHELTSVLPVSGPEGTLTRGMVHRLVKTMAQTPAGRAELTQKINGIVAEQCTTFLARRGASVRRFDAKLVQSLGKEEHGQLNAQLVAALEKAGFIAPRPPVLISNPCFPNSRALVQRASAAEGSLTGPEMLVKHPFDGTDFCAFMYGSLKRRLGVQKDETVKGAQEQKSNEDMPVRAGASDDDGSVMADDCEEQKKDKTAGLLGKNPFVPMCFPGMRNHLTAQTPAIKAPPMITEVPFFRGRSPSVIEEVIFSGDYLQRRLSRELPLFKRLISENRPSGDGGAIVLSRRPIIAGSFVTRSACFYYDEENYRRFKGAVAHPGCGVIVSGTGDEAFVADPEEESAGSDESITDAMRAWLKNFVKEQILSVYGHKTFRSQKGCWKIPSDCSSEKSENLHRKANLDKISEELNKKLSQGSGCCWLTNDELEDYVARVCGTLPLMDHSDQRHVVPHQGLFTAVGYTQEDKKTAVRDALIEIFKIKIVKK